jgi:hypothetical protein
LTKLYKLSKLCAIVNISKTLGDRIVNNVFKLCTTSLILLGLSGNIWAAESFELAPYAGVDAQMRHMSFERHFGGNIFHKSYPQANVFLGLKFKECVGVEIGYEFSKTQRHARNYNVGDVVFGQTLTSKASNPLLLSEHFAGHAAAKTYGWNFNLVGFKPVICGDNNLQLIGSIGFAHLRLKVHHLLINTNVLLNAFALEEGVRQPLTEVIFDTRNYKSRKNIFRMATGVQHMWGDCLGIRALITWEYTTKLKAKKNQHSTIADLRLLTKAKLKNSFLYGIGVFIPF